jgi:hypothetical protein
MKTLKKWNGRGTHKRRNGTFFIAAYTLKQAAIIYNHATLQKDSVIDDFFIGRATREIKNYFSDSGWGDPMKGIVPDCPCIYFREGYSGTPKLIHSFPNLKK